MNRVSIFTKVKAQRIKKSTKIMEFAKGKRAKKGKSSQEASPPQRGATVRDWVPLNADEAVKDSEERKIIEENDDEELNVGSGGIVTSTPNVLVVPGGGARRKSLKRERGTVNLFSGVKETKEEMKKRCLDNDDQHKATTCSPQQSGLAKDDPSLWVDYKFLDLVEGAEGEDLEVLGDDNEEDTKLFPEDPYAKDDHLKSSVCSGGEERVEDFLHLEAKCRIQPLEPMVVVEKSLEDLAFHSNKNKDFKGSPASFETLATSKAVVKGDLSSSPNSNESFIVISKTTKQKAAAADNDQEDDNNTEHQAAEPDNDHEDNDNVEDQAVANKDVSVEEQLGLDIEEALNSKSNISCIEGDSTLSNLSADILNLEIIEKAIDRLISHSPGRGKAKRRVQFSPESAVIKRPDHFRTRHASDCDRKSCDRKNCVGWKLEHVRRYFDTRIKRSLAMLERTLEEMRRRFEDEDPVFQVDMPSCSALIREASLGFRNLVFECLRRQSMGNIQPSCTAECRDRFTVGEFLTSGCLSCQTYMATFLRNSQIYGDVGSFDQAVYIMDKIPMGLPQFVQRLGSIYNGEENYQHEHVRVPEHIDRVSCSISFWARKPALRHTQS